MPTNEVNKKITVLEIEPVSDRGGVTQFIARIVAYLPQESFDPHFAASGNGAAFDMLQQYGVASHHIEIEYSFRNFFSRVRALRTLLQEQHIDIIHAHTGRAGLLAVQAAKGTATKVVFTAHGWRFLQLRNPFKKLFIFLIERRIVRHADAVTYLTQGECILGKQLAPQQQHYVIPLSLNIADYQKKDQYSFRKQYNISPDIFVVSMVGRIAFQKDPETFARAAALVAEAIPQAQFIWAGEGELRGLLPTRIITTGQLPHNEVVALLEESDLLLFTSRFEGLPISLLEAMAAKLPVVAAKVSGIPEIIIEGQTGALFEKGDAMQAAEKIVDLYNDPIKRSQYAQQAFELVQKEFSPIQRCSQAFAAVYKKVYESNH